MFVALNLWVLSLPKFYVVWTKNNSNTCLGINNGFMNLHETGLTTGCLFVLSNFLLLLLFNVATYPKRKSPYSEAFPTYLALAVFSELGDLAAMCWPQPEQNVSVKFQC